MEKAKQIFKNILNVTLNIAIKLKQYTYNVYTKLSDFIRSTDRALLESVIWFFIAVPFFIWALFISWKATVIILILWFLENFLRKRWAKMALANEPIHYDSV